MSSASPNNKSSKRATIYDLAKFTGVSPGTVSRVLNNRDRVKPETRDRILKAAKQLNLKPQVAVRMRRVAILSEPTFHDRFGGYAASVTAHLAFAFSRREIAFMLPTNPIEELPVAFLDGIVAVTFDTALRSMLEELETRIPVVYLDKFDIHPRQYAVCSDHYSSGYIAARHFISRGKSRPAFFAPDRPPYQERLKGFKKGLTEGKIPIDERLLQLAPMGSNHSSLVTRIVKGGADCIYVPGTSFQAIEVLHILNYVMGIKVPQDMSIIGGENDGISNLLSPPLTTVEEPLHEMAESAVELIDQLIEGQKVSNRQVVLPVRLIQRDSVS